MTTYTPVTTSSESVGDLRQMTQFAPCLRCGATLQHDTGDYGESLERCTNADCLGSAWHLIVTPPITREPATPHKRRGPQGTAKPRPRNATCI